MGNFSIRNIKIRICIILFFIAVVLAGVLFYFNTDTVSNSVTYNDFAMGSDVTLTLYSKNDELAQEVFASIHELDGKISKNIKNSEVSQINNATDYITAPTVTSILNQIDDLCIKSDFALNPACGALSDLWNIDGSAKTPPLKEQINSSKANCDYGMIHIKGTDIKLDSGCKIDLGAVGKGAACDQALKALGDTPAVVSVGGSIATNSAKPDKTPWNIAVRDPDDPNEKACIISIEGSTCLSTSGAYEKYFVHDGVKYHHILDTETGYPVDTDIISATVICDSALMSDALSTAVFALGKDKCKDLLNSFNASAVIIDKDGNLLVTKDIYDNIISVNEKYVKGMI